MRLSTLRGAAGLGLLLTRGEGVRDHDGAADNGSLMLHTGT